MEQTLRRETAGLNEYDLAVEFFNRKGPFNPEIDPIVRVEAGKLRHRLRGYYAGEGREDAVMIELPPRTYVPAFRSRPPAAVTGEPPVPATSLRATAIWGLGAMALVLAAAIWWLFGPWPGTSPDRPPDRLSASDTASLAVLPFLDLSSDRGQEYFCDGLTEEVIEALTKLSNLRVVSRTSSFRFKGSTDDVRSIGRQLNVGMVLEGSVRRFENKLRVTAKLVTTADGYHLWSQTYDRQIEDVFAIQDEIASAIGARLQADLRDLSWRRPRHDYRPDPKAYHAFLKGLRFTQEMNADAFRSAIEQFEEAIRIDPNYAEARGELAEYCSLLALTGGVPSQELMAKAKAAAVRAVELNRTLPHAHAALGLVKGLHEWDWEGARREFLEAHDLDPSGAHVHEMYALGYLVPTGRLEEAFSAIGEALSFDPVSPRIISTAGSIYYFRGQYDLAIPEFRKALELEPDFRSTHLDLASVYTEKSMFGDALGAIQRGRTDGDANLALSSLGYTYARMGWIAEARRILGQLVQASKQKYVSPVAVASVYAGLGDRDRAFQWLEEAHGQRCTALAYLKVNPHFANLRGDRRYADLLKRIHLH